MVEVRKLGFMKAGAAPAGAEAPVRPKGWGAPAADDAHMQSGTPGARVSDERMRQLAGVQAPPAEEPTRPRGWGPPAGAPADPQREEIRQKISAPPAQPPAEDEGDEEAPVSVRALQAFGPGIVEQLEEESESAEDVPQQRTAATDTEPVQPRGWGAPAEHAPAETEAVTSAVRAAPAHEWAGLSTRYVNALKAAGYTSAFEAWEAGKEALSTVDRFGPKGWAELEAVYGAHDVWGLGKAQEQLDAREAQARAVGAAGDGAQSVIVNKTRAVGPTTIAARDTAEDGETAERDEEEPYIRINIEVQGLNREQLAGLFGSLASRFLEG